MKNCYCIIVEVLSNYVVITFVLMMKPFFPIDLTTVIKEKHPTLY